MVYIGAKEIHVDLKQCMKLDVLDVNCWQLNGRILGMNVVNKEGINIAEDGEAEKESGGGGARCEAGLILFWGGGESLLQSGRGRAKGSGLYVIIKTYLLFFF